MMNGISQENGNSSRQRIPNGHRSSSREPATPMIRMSNGVSEPNMISSLKRLQINNSNGNGGGGGVGYVNGVGSNQQVARTTTSNGGGGGTNRSDATSKTTSNGKKSIDERYEILTRIGSGSYAVVYKAINREDGRIYAIKKIPMTSESNNLINEIKIMSECKHQNIVSYFGSDCDIKEVSILMEYCDGGSVKDAMKYLNCTLNYRQILAVLRDTLRGIEYLHSKGKIHRDVKAANILLHEDGIAKLGDFGVSEPTDTSIKGQIIGTLLWLPPEVINHTIDPSNSSVIDIWSLGVTIIEMADGQPPYNEINPANAMREIGDLTKPSPTFRDPSQWPEELQQFLALCLEKQAAQRPTAKQLLEHRIFADAEQQNISPKQEISALVRKVCFSSARSTELESDLYRKSENLLIDICLQFTKYKDRRRKVVKVDKMTELLRSLEDSFRRTQTKVAKGNDEIDRLSLELESLEKEKLELSGRRDVLKTKLSDGRGREESIKKQIQTIENRREKLRSLESSKAG